MEDQVIDRQVKKTLDTEGERKDLRSLKWEKSTSKEGMGMEERRSGCVIVSRTCRNSMRSDTI